MRNIEIYDLFDKSKLGKGEWLNELDKAQWLDEKTNLACLIVRNRLGALCGYVGISSSHPYFSKHYEKCKVTVHGGLSYSDFCMPHEHPEPKVCHLVEVGEDDNIWWLGFDCMHSMDLVPASQYLHIEKYRNVDFVKNECTALADQLSKIRK